MDFEPVPCCPLCREVTRVHIDRGASVVRCRACGHRYVDPRPTADTIKSAWSRSTVYDEWLAAQDLRRVWQSRFARTLAGTAPGRLLDVGAGLGAFLAVAREAGWAVEGTEVSTMAIDHARRLFGVKLVHGTLGDVALSGEYDAIALWHVIEHMPEPAVSLRTCHSLLRRGGLLFVAVANDGLAAWRVRALANGVRRLLGRSPARRYSSLLPGGEAHLQLFDEASIVRTLRDCGFDIRSVGGVHAKVPLSAAGRTRALARRGLTAITPWNFGRELLIVAARP